MKKGFTIVELLVASMLLGMLMTILTMIFNQSSVAWRTGQATVSELGKTRGNIAQLQDEADNAFIWGNKTYQIQSIWDEDNNGQYAKRACNVVDYKAPEKIGSYSMSTTLNNIYSDHQKTISEDNSQGGSMKNYIVNVKSAGPDRSFDTWDDIWSFPDDFE